MVDELDLLRQLIGADPAPEDPLVTDRLVERVMARAVPQLARPRSRAWYRARWLACTAVAAVVAAAGGSVAFAELAGSRAPTDLGEARCYSVASLKGGNNFYGLTVAASGPPGRPAVVTDALATCTVDWQQGFLALGDPALRKQLPPAERRVPHLVVCVLPDGIAAVFPGNAQTCQKLGLSNSSPQKSNGPVETLGGA